MPRPKGHIAVIAEMYGVTPKYVRDVIKRHPELGITLKAREATILDANQQTALGAAIEREMARYEAPPIEIKGNRGEPELKPSCGAVETEYQKEIDSLKEEIAGLKADLAAAEADAKVAEARAEERQNHIDDLKNAQGEQRKLLEAAQAEAESYRKSIFGFYRKAKSKDGEL